MTLSVCFDADKIGRYVKYQEAKERQSEIRQQRLFKQSGDDTSPLLGREEVQCTLQLRRFYSWNEYPQFSKHP